MFRAIISPILRSTGLCLQLVVQSTKQHGHQQATSSVLYTTSCKHSPVLLRMGEIIARNMLSWLKLLIKQLFLHLVGRLYYCINDARSHNHYNFITKSPITASCSGFSWAIFGFIELFRPTDEMYKTYVQYTGHTQRIDSAHFCVYIIVYTLKIVLQDHR